VKIERLSVQGFGKLGSFDTGAAPLGSLVVVLGPNEAGKSTLFSFLTTALYGFHPASRDRNPHVPWDTDEAGGEVRLRLSDGGCASVARTLRSSPSARLTVGEATREIRNQPVPWVEHVPRPVFRQVFAVTLSELAGLDQETWARIQDRVVGAMGASDLEPARLVAEALEREASELWRPNRRGNQKLRELQEEIRGLRSTRLEALERDRLVRQRVGELEDARHNLRELRGERARSEVVLERVQELLPVRRQLERIAELRTTGGPRDELAGLPEDPAESLRRLDEEQDRLKREMRRLATDRVAPARVTARWDDEARALQSRRGEITTLARRAAALSDRASRSTLEAQARELRAQLDTAADQLLTDPGAEEGVRALSIDLLRDRVERAETARARAARQAEEERARADSDSGGALDSSPLPIFAAVGVGAAALAWGSLGGPGLAAPLGAALAAVGLTLWLLRRRTGPSVGPETDGRASPDPTHELEAEITAMLGDLPVRPAFVDPPGPALVSAIERMQALLIRRDEVARLATEASHDQAALEEEAVQVARDLGAHDLTDPLEIADRLEHRLLEADRSEEAARAATGELERLDRDAARLEEEHEGLAARESELRSTLRRIAGSDDADPPRTVMERMDAHRRADRLLDELERTRPDLAEMKARIREAEEQGASWTINDADLADRRAHLAELRDRIESLVGRAQALETEIAHLREAETVDAVDGAILALQDEEKRLTARRDRTWLIAHLLRTADRRFREEHQPDLLRRASAYMERLTAGRYHRILVDELGDGDLFQLAGPGLPRPVPLSRPISTGTLEQAYLSLRLAIVDHLDHGQERLPLFLDEALVNWDEARRERGLEVLSEISESRQVFAFTCHPDMARRLEAHGAQLVRLER
jgi:uncharacterized protein YhaN